jgi:hypothetical protein
MLPAMFANLVRGHSEDLLFRLGGRTCVMAGYYHVRTRVVGVERVFLFRVHYF